MTEIVFHFNAPDKMAYACRFVRKAQRSGAKVVIVGSTDSLTQLDVMLWNMAPHDFVAHCSGEASEDIVDFSPVLLAEHAQHGNHREILLNLGQAVPEGFEDFQRLVEIVSATDETDRSEARLRWRHYLAKGYEITRHDLDLKAE